MNYYNENCPSAAAWLRELIRCGHIPDGHVDDRSIVDVRASDLDGYVQHHFFAGISGWSLALRLAGWPDDEPVATASCPCQPLSCAGAGRGEKDERHLWPEFYRLVSERRFGTIFGEQVGSPLGLEWLDGISLDLEELGYAVGANDLPAACVGSPNIRQRIFWVAHANGGKRSRITDGEGRDRDWPEARREQSDREPQRGSDVRGLADTDGQRRSERSERDGESHGPRLETPQRNDAVRCSDIRGLGHAGSPRSGRHTNGCVTDESVDAGVDGGLGDTNESGPQRRPLGGSSERTARATGVGCWSECDLIPCADGKSRRVESRTFPLAFGIPSRMGPLLAALRPMGRSAIAAARSNRVLRLHGYGNSIVPQVAAEFIRAYRDARIGDRVTPTLDLDFA